MGDWPDEDTGWNGEPLARGSEGHAVFIGQNGYEAACGGEVVVDEGGYHCAHVKL